MLTECKEYMEHRTAIYRDIHEAPHRRARSRVSKGSRHH
ncbi:hypothetical protein MIDIC_20034 [Alphaproteobacteria bacterium]